MLSRPLRCRLPGGHNAPVFRRLFLLATLAPLGLAACDPESSMPADDAGTPLDPLSFKVTDEGPYACGHRVVETTYTPPGGLPPRTIPIHLWYPSNVAEGDHPKYRALFI